MPDGWLAQIRRLQAIAQTGLWYSSDLFDRERYEELREIAMTLLASSVGRMPAEIEDLFSADEGYATPKVDVRAAVFREDSILMVRERSDRLWTLPGGWADVGTSPGEVAEKETREESGYIVRATKVCAVYDRAKHGHPPLAHHVYKMFMCCELDGGEARTGDETIGVDFFPERELPELSLTRVTAAQIARMFEHHRSPTLPTDFD